MDENGGARFKDFCLVTNVNEGFDTDLADNSLLGLHRPDLLLLPTTNSEHFTGDAIRRGDLAQAQMLLVAVLASEVASKNICAQVASDHENSVKVFVEGLKALKDATQFLQSMYKQRWN